MRRYYLVRCLLGLILVVLGLGSAEAIPTVSKTEFYEVKGTNLHSLLASIRANRPFSNPAFTRWYVDSTYQFVNRPGDCLLRNCDVRLRVVMTLPKWIDAPKADSALRAEWARYVEALLRHEQGHADLAAAAAKALVSSFNSRTWRAQTQEALKSLLDQEKTRIIDEYKEKETTYDSATRHGLAQGAHLRFSREWSAH